MVELFGIDIPNLYMGGGIGIVILIAIIWFLIKNSRSGRIGTELEEIKEDVELERGDREIRRTEKEEKYQSEYLKDLLYGLHKRAIKLGLEGYEKRNILTLDYISKGLKVLIKEEISVLQEEDVIKKINEAIDRYLNNFPPTQDPEINNWISRIREIQARLYSSVRREDALLSEEEQLLRRKYSKIQKERGA